MPLNPINQPTNYLFFLVESFILTYSTRDKYKRSIKMELFFLF